MDNKMMNPDHVQIHTTLLELEEDLLEQVDTCQQLLSAMWSFLQSTGENLHLPTVKRFMVALYAIESNVEEEMFNVRLDLLPHAHPLKFALDFRTTD